MRLTGLTGSRLLLLAAVALACNGDDLTGPRTGIVRVHIATSGPEPDPDGYTLQLDDGPAQPVAVTAVLSLTDLPAGTHLLRLSGLAPNCLSAESERTVAVGPGEIAVVQFAVDCKGTLGAIEITTLTTGVDLDPDGYLIQLDGAFTIRIGVNDLFTWSRLAPHLGTLEISELATNCRVQGPSSQPVGIRAGQLTRIAFTITCSAPDLSRIAFDSYRDGASDIYVMSPDGSGLTNLTRNGAESSWRPVWSPDGRRIAFQLAPGFDIGVINADGSGKVNLTNTVPQAAGDRSNNEESHPTWSPDGTSIAYSRDHAGLLDEANWDIFVIRLDGGEVTNLTRGGGSDYLPNWSPDGRMIAYESGSSLCIMNSDGTGQLCPASTGLVAEALSWSPDGGTVMTSGVVDSHWEIRLINRDGTGERTIVTDGASVFSPVWSPDGSRIAFASDALEVVNADGTGRRKVTPPGMYVGKPSWSPDGTKIAHTGPGPDPNDWYTTRDIYVTDVNTFEHTNLTNSQAPDDNPAWSPR